MEYAIKFRPVKPASPHLNVKVERLQRTDLDEFYRTADLKSPDLSQWLEEWQDHYNQFRVHGSLSGRTPWEARGSDFRSRLSAMRLRAHTTSLRNESAIRTTGLTYSSRHRTKGSILSDWGFCPKTPERARASKERCSSRHDQPWVCETELDPVINQGFHEALPASRFPPSARSECSSLRQDRLTVGSSSLYECRGRRMMLMTAVVR